MPNIGDIFQLLQAVDKLGITLSDALTLYGLYQKVETAKKLDIAELAKSGQLPVEADALARATTAFAQLLKDPVQKPRIISLLSSL